MKQNKKSAVFFTVLFGLAVSLQSCFIWKTNVEWDSMALKKKEPRPQPNLSIGKKPHFILLPFIVILYSTNSYYLDFRLTDKKQVDKIDSIKYKVFSESSQVYSGSFIPKSYEGNNIRDMKVYKKMNLDIDTAYYVSFRTRLENLALNKSIDSLRVDFDVFMKGDLGRNYLIEYRSCRLKKDGKRFGSLL